MLPSNRFHRHSIAQLLERSVELFFQELGSYAKLTAVLIVPTIVFNAIYFQHMHKLFTDFVAQIQKEEQADYPDENKEQAIINDFAQNFFHMFTKLVWLVIFIVLLASVLKAAMIRTTVQAFLPAPVTLWTNVRHGINRLPQMMLWCLFYLVGLIIYTIAVGIAIMIVMVLAILLLGQDAGLIVYILLQLGNLVLSYYIALVLVFCMPLIVVERVSALRSFERAWDMAAGHRCMILCSELILLLAAMLVFALEYLAFAGMGWTVLAVVHGLTCMIWIPLGTILVTMLYLNVRVDKEGLNAQVLKDELDKGDADVGLAGGESISPSIDPLVSASVADGGSYQPLSLNDLHDDKETGVSAENETNNVV